MPTNLNALIRYKTIDRSLRNRSMKCTIQRLQEECSEALGEKRGVYKMVSERTIRDDIRVLRSDILGFNAPIIYEDGYYFYSNPEYSIFEEYVMDKKMIFSIYYTLLENRNSMNKSIVNITLSRLAAELKISLPPEIFKEIIAERESREFDHTDINRSCYLPLDPSENESKISAETKYDSETRFMAGDSKVEEPVSINQIETTSLEYPALAAKIEKNYYFFPWKYILQSL